MKHVPTAYPLTWPPGFRRTPAPRREKGAFKTTLAGALNNVQDSLRRFATDSGQKLEGLVISSNVTLGAARPADPAVAVWFVWDKLSVCIAVDRYATVEANLQAIHHIIEARRVELRHGTLQLVRATFSGFKALAPPPGDSWREVLGFGQEETPAAHELKLRYQRQRAEAHPDKGGSAEQFDRVERAFKTACEEMGYE